MPGGHLHGMYAQVNGCSSREPVSYLGERVSEGTVRLADAPYMQTLSSLCLRLESVSSPVSGQSMLTHARRSLRNMFPW